MRSDKAAFVAIIASSLRPTCTSPVAKHAALPFNEVDEFFGSVEIHQAIAFRSAGVNLFRLFWPPAIPPFRDISRCSASVIAAIRSLPSATAPGCFPAFFISRKVYPNLRALRMHHHSLHPTDWYEAYADLAGERIKL
jgi:hypothetical protein